MRIGLHVLCFVAVASVAAAQPSYVTHHTYTPPNGQNVQAFFAWLNPGEPVADRPGYVWRHDGKGWYWELGGTPTPGPVPDDCDRVNGYTDPERATRCAASKNTVHPTVPVYQVGREYEYVYPNTSYRMVVIGLSRSLDGVEVVTFQWTRDAGTGHKIGDVKACRNDNGASAESSCTLWAPAR